MKINELEDAYMQGMRANLPPDEETATTFNYNYPGKAELHRFYESCLRNDIRKHPLVILDKCMLPVGLLLTFALFIIGMFMPFDNKVSMLGMLCGFGTILGKAYTLNEIKKIKIDESGFDFVSLNAYRSQYQRHGFTGGRRLPYCLMGDTAAQYRKEKKAISPSIWIFVSIISVFLALGITYLVTMDNEAARNVAFELVIGIGFMLIGLLLGVGTLFRPIVKGILYGRRVNAVCVDVDRFTTVGEPDSTRPVYMAIVDGKDYIYFEDMRSNFQESSVGDVFPIYVSRRNPYNFSVTQSSGNVMFGLIFFLSFGVVGTVLTLLGLNDIGLLHF